MSRGRWCAGGVAGGRANRRHGWVAGPALALAGIPALALALGALPSLAHAQPGRPDPRAMSGIPRPDPQVPAGTVTVRVLRGGFELPAAGVEVVLAIRGSDGSTAERRATTASIGRAEFADLAAFTGGTAIASAVVDGETLTSQPIALRSDIGTRVLLVLGAAASPGAGAVQGAGAAQGAGASLPAAPHGGAALPEPGQPFPLPDRADGTVIVGALARSGPVQGIAVTLRLQPAGGGDPVVHTRTTDVDGRAVFEGVAAGAAAGTLLQVEATLRAGAEPQRSVEFPPPGRGGVAVVLTDGFGLDELQAATPEPAVGAPPLPPPRREPSLPVGVVAVRVVDGQGRPVAAQTVDVVRKDVTGTDERFTATTDAAGVARVEGVAVRDDSVYFAGAIHDGGPYQSTFFRLDERSGVAVDLRVWPTTSDLSRVRSAVQFEVQPRENDLAQVIQIYEAYVDGDEALWLPSGLQVGGPSDARGFTVLQRAEDWLEHAEGAPFATLREPIPPGQVVRLSVAYLVPHAGTARVRWSPPLPVVEASIVLPASLQLASPNVEGKPVPHSAGPAAPAPEDAATVFELGARPVGSSLDFDVAGLPTRPWSLRWIAAGVGALMLAAAGLAVATRPRLGTRERLLARLDGLRERLLAEQRAGASAAVLEPIAAALDNVVRQLEALDGAGPLAAQAAAARASATAATSPPPAAPEPPAQPEGPGA